MKQHLVNRANITRIDDGFRLSIDPTTATEYSDAQLDDYSAARPFVFRHGPPRHLCARARFSHARGALKGTAGFGFWNHPFGGGGGLIPRSAWFFYGSPESNLRFTRATPGHGFKAAQLDALPIWRRASPLMRAPKSSAAVEQDAPTSALFRIANHLLGSRALFGPAIRAAQAVFRADEQLIDGSIDIRDWHDYHLDWGVAGTRWSIDGRVVFEARSAPPGPLGLVIWIDNYRAVLDERGAFGFSHVATEQTQWLDITRLTVTP